MVRWPVLLVAVFALPCAASAQAVVQAHAAGGRANLGPYLSGGVERISSQGFLIGADIGAVLLPETPPPSPFSRQREDKLWTLSALLGWHAPAYLAWKIEPFVVGGLSPVSDPEGIKSVMAFTAGAGGTYWFTAHVGLHTVGKVWFAIGGCCLSAIQAGIAIR